MPQPRPPAGPGDPPAPTAAAALTPVYFRRDRPRGSLQLCMGPQAQHFIGSNGSLRKPPRGAGAALLHSLFVARRLEMAAEIPTPAEHLNARRALQLQLLTKRHDPAPVQTWGHDVATVLGSGFEASQARRLQNALKILLKP